jgi:hypothetical protein
MDTAPVLTVFGLFAVRRSITQKMRTLAALKSALLRLVE